MSPQKLLDVWIFRASQCFVCSAEDDIALAHHHDLTISETEPLTLALKNHFALFVDYSIFGTDVVEIVHLVSHEDRGDVFQVAQLHGELADGPGSRWIETGGR